MKKHCPQLSPARHFIGRRLGERGQAAPTNDEAHGHAVPSLTETQTPLLAACLLAACTLTKHTDLNPSTDTSTAGGGTSRSRVYTGEHLSFQLETSKDHAASGVLFCSCVRVRVGQVWAHRGVAQCGVCV